MGASKSRQQQLPSLQQINRRLSQRQDELKHVIDEMERKDPLNIQLPKLRMLRAQFYLDIEDVYELLFDCEQKKREYTETMKSLESFDLLSTIPPPPPSPTAEMVLDI